MLSEARTKLFTSGVAVQERICNTFYFVFVHGFRERLTGHNAAVFGLAASPTDDCFLSGSDDFRARFWYADRSDD